MRNAFTEEELKILEKSLIEIDGIKKVTIIEHEPFQKLEVIYIHKEFGKMSFEIESAHAFDTLEELEDACKSYITKDCVLDE